MINGPLPKFHGTRDNLSVGRQVGPLIRQVPAPALGAPDGSQRWVASLRPAAGSSNHIGAPPCPVANPGQSSVFIAHTADRKVWRAQPVGAA
jgi:hypothetical protein